MRPIEVSSLVDTSLDFPPAVVTALKALRDANPWAGEWDTRFAALRTCSKAIRVGFGLEPWEVVHVGETEGSSARSRLRVKLTRIELRGRLSVITMLVLTFRSMGMGVRDAYTRAVTLFRKYFPRSFAGCKFENGLIVRAESEQS